MTKESRVEQLKSRYGYSSCTTAGQYTYKMLEGFAEILDNSEDVHTLDTDLVDIYIMLGLKNGSTMQITGQIVDIEMDEYGNYVKLRMEDRKVGTMPNSTFIFSLNDISTIQSLDIVQHQKRLEAKMEKELSEQKAEKEAALDTLFTKNTEDIDAKSE